MYSRGLQVKESLHASVGIVSTQDARDGVNMQKVQPVMLIDQIIIYGGKIYYIRDALR